MIGIIVVACFTYTIILRRRKKTYNKVWGICIGCNSGPDETVFSNVSYGGKFEYTVDNKKYIHNDMGWNYKEKLEIGKAYTIYYKNGFPNQSYSEGELSESIYFIVGMICVIIAILGVLFDI